MDLVYFKLKYYDKPACLSQYPVQKSHKEMFHKEEELFSTGIPWKGKLLWIGEKMFEQPKLISKQAHILSGFRNLNKQLNLKQYPMPKINEMLLKPEVF